MMTRRLVAATLLGATALAAATTASAQRVERIVAFGDSYADTGNFFRLIGGNPVAQIYPTGRFSGGTNYIDSLGQTLGVPVTNFAISGALTNDYNTNTGPGLGFPTEVGSFLAGGTPLFPAIAPRFGANDLLAVSIGGNDARLYQRGSVANGTPGPVIAPGTLLGAPAAGAASAAAAKTGLDALVAAGARNISFLAGNTTLLPEVASDPAAQAIRNSYSTTFATAIQPVLAGYAANGVIVNYLDLSLALQRIAANPAAYGLTSAGVCPVSCVSTPSQQSQYLFYVDGLHLTSAGFAIVARYVAAQMTAPLTLGATSDLALDTGRQFGRTLTTRMDLGSPRDGELLSGVRLFAVADGFSRTAPASFTSEHTKLRSVGATVGVEAGFGGGTAGIAANYSRPRANVGAGLAHSRSQSYQIGAFAGFGLAGGFAQGYVGYGKDDHRLTRLGVIDSMRADADGSHWLAGAKAGYLMPFGGLRAGPVIALDYAKAKVDGYTETGDAALTLNVRSQEFSSMRGSAGLELRGDMGTAEAPFRPFLSVVAERDFKGDGRTAVYAQTSAPTIVNRFRLADASKKTYARGTAGLTAGIVGGLSVDAAASMTFGKNQGNETSAQVGFNLGF